MPDISASLHILDATCFLYPSREAAEAGEGFGGSGVLVSVPLISRPDQCFVYIVSNWHVAVSGGFSVVRLNKIDGGVHIIEFGPEDWHFVPKGPDLAAVQVPLPKDVKTTFLSLNMFVTDDLGEAFVGDDVFTVGRFIDYDGQETNEPSLRFGAISMMDASVHQLTGFRGRSIIVDTHSRTGFSGSPVYLYRPGAIVITGVSMGNTSAPKLNGPKTSQRTWGFGNDTRIKLLGVHWGQFPERWEIARHEKYVKSAAAQAAKITAGEYVEGLSGMSCICPASQVVDLLQSEKLRQQRQELEARLQ